MQEQKGDHFGESGQKIIAVKNIDGIQKKITVSYSGQILIIFEISSVEKNRKRSK